MVLVAAARRTKLLIVLTVLLSASWLFADVIKAAENEPTILQRAVAVKDVCAWPNLTLLGDGTMVAVIHNQPAHGTREGDIECWASTDGIEWEKRSTITGHEPNTVRMNHAAGLAKNGDLIVLCSGWTNEKQSERPKQPAFRDNILRTWTCRSKNGGRTWTTTREFPAPEVGYCEYIPFGDIWRGGDGALHTSCYHAKFVDPAKTFRTQGWRAWHLRSDDDGKTWKPTSMIDPRANETDIFPLGGKRWLAAARHDAVYLVRSEDDGATWSGREKVTAANEINGHLTRLKDGRLLLSYGVRIAGEEGVRARLSPDDGKTWSAPIRLAQSNDRDCGYPSSVQRGDGKIVTAYYSKSAPELEQYHMGVVVWDAPSPTAAKIGKPAQPAEFQHAGITDVWKIYADRLTFGKGQTLALVDDGCKLSMPEWQAAVGGVPKVRVAFDAVDGDDDPKHEGRGYHGSTIGIPSSVNYQGKWGVAYHNQVAVIRGLECCHCKIADSQSLAAALQWILDHHEQHHITTVNLAPVDDKAHAEPVATEIDDKLAALREQGIWVSAPAGNHNFTTGISWPASQPNCFAIGAVRPGKDEVYLDRHAKIALLVPARATSSSNAIACGAVMLLREAIEKTDYDWKADGQNLPEAMLAILQETGKLVEDAATGLSFRRLDLLAALEHVYSQSVTGSDSKP